MERIKRYLRSAAGYQAVCAKWLVLAALVGCVAALPAARCRSCYRIFVSPL